MSLRKDARRAAADHVPWTDLVGAADKVSDLWEPVVRELVGMVKRHWSRGQPVGEVEISEFERIREIMESL